MPNEIGTVVTFILDILVSAGGIFLVASGLVVVYGWARLINMAHGDLVMVGAYTCVIAVDSGFPYWLSTLLAAALVGLVLLAGHLAVFKRMPQEGMSTLLATWGLGLMLTEGVRLLYGPGGRFVDPPVTGLVTFPGGVLPAYQVALFGVAVVLAGVAVFVTTRTRLGLRVRAVVERPDAAAMSGLNPGRQRSALVLMGGGLAGLAGAVIAPMAPVTPYLGPVYSTTAFSIVLMSGTRVGVMPIMAALFLGTTRVATQTFLSPSIAAIATLVLSIVAIIAVQGRLSRP
jgi:branched-subunit amino acid ABC-type transport system permease component